MKILENAVPFATGSCRKFKPDDSALYLRLKLILPQLPTVLATAMALFFLFGGAKEPIIWASSSTERVQKKFSGPVTSL